VTHSSSSRFIERQHNNFVITVAVFDTEFPEPMARYWFKQILEVSVASYGCDFSSSGVKVVPVGT
jgi:hypothetical protein